MFEEEGCRHEEGGQGAKDGEVPHDVAKGDCVHVDPPHLEEEDEEEGGHEEEHAHHGESHVGVNDAIAAVVKEEEEDKGHGCNHGHKDDHVQQGTAEVLGRSGLRL